MGRFRKKLNQWTAQVIDLPPDVMLDIPRMTMVGNIRLYIENHRGIVHFSEDRLKLALSNGFLELNGKELVVRAISAEEILIEGLISELKYMMNEKR
ncbi:MAG: sporulation protein YqfC [Bacilli bacterium]|jgi:sporulation protein YqfC|nr:sporulation protein YqfC [Bacilli bacterium]